MRVPFKMEESFKYASVNGKDTLPHIPVTQATPRARMPDSLNAEERQAWRDSVRVAARARARATADSIERGLRPRQVRRAQCDTSDTRTFFNVRHDGQLPVAIKVPCDMSTLENSPELPGSIYDKGEELFGAKDLEALKNEALSMGAQAPFSFRLQAGLLPPPIFAYGPSMMRYNRVEGLSVGGSVEQQFGGGYTGTAVGRLGVADWEPNIELTGTRSNVSNTIGLSVYNHLVSASDWGASALVRELVLCADVWAETKASTIALLVSRSTATAPHRSAAARGSIGARFSSGNAPRRRTRTSRSTEPIFQPISSHAAVHTRGSARASVTATASTREVCASSAISDSRVRWGIRCTAARRSTLRRRTGSDSWPRR
jgi:hypothetical protein